MKKVLAAIFFSFFAVSVCSAYSTGSFVTTSNLNVRYSPLVANNRIDHLAVGEFVQVTEVKGTWCKITHFKFSNAYVNCSYLNKSDELPPYFNIIPSRLMKEAEPSLEKEQNPQQLLDYFDTFVNDLFIGENSAKVNLNIRSLPSVRGARIGYFTKGDPVTVKSVTGDWCQVDYKDYGNAYVHCGYLNVGMDKITDMFKSAIGEF